jgi:hypothetical protein
MTLDVLKEWWYYLFPMHRVPPLLGVLPLRHRHGRDHHHGPRTAQPAGLNIDWIATPVSNCYKTGNHLGIQPHAFKDMLDFFVDDIEEITGIQVQPQFRKKAPTSCSSPRRAMCSPTRAPTPAWATCCCSTT